MDTEIDEIKTSWANGGSVKYQLIGDNWDKNILPSYRTSDRKTISLHLFNIYAIVDRVIPQKPPTDAIHVIPDLHILEFIPSLAEQEKLLEELVFIFSTSVINSLPQLEQHFSKIYPKHLPHTHSNYSAVKTSQVLFFNKAH